MKRRRDMRHVVVFAAGFLASSLAYGKLSAAYPSGYLEAPGPKALVTFLLPTAAAVIYLLVRSLVIASWPAGRAAWASTETHDADDVVSDILFWILLFVMSIHGLVLAVLLRAEWIYPWAGRAVVVLLGMLLITVGNLLPRTRPNAALGIRTARTLADRRLWMSTHRIGGYVVVVVGIVTAVSGVFVTRANMPVLPALVGLGGGLLTMVCYRRFAAIQEF
jgi:hypothetical protein